MEDGRNSRRMMQRVEAQRQARGHGISGLKAWARIQAIIREDSLSKIIPAENAAAEVFENAIRSRYSAQD
jgi:hypothetical protein